MSSSSLSCQVKLPLLTYRYAVFVLMHNVAFEYFTLFDYLIWIYESLDQNLSFLIRFLVFNLTINLNTFLVNFLVD
jgi:hypothetical protein